MCVCVCVCVCVLCEGVILGRVVMNVWHSAVCVWEQSLEVPSLDLCMCVC